MKLVTAQDDRGTVVLASGRLDAAGSDHFAKLIEDLLRDGERTVHVDLSGVTYLSTPGLRALAQAYQNFSALRGEFRVLQPPPPIRAQLDLAGLSDRVLAESRTTSSGRRMRPSSVGFRLGEFTFDAWEVPGLPTTQGDYAVTIRPGATTFSWRAIGHPAGSGPEAIPEPVVWTPQTSGFGLGAIGTTADDATGRVGELLGLAGAVAYQPTDSHRADCLTTIGERPPTALVASGLVVEGEYSHLIRFRTQPDVEATPLAEVAETALDTTGKNAAVIAIVAESAGLVGCCLRQPPEPGAVVTFDLAATRERFFFTPHRAFAGLTAIVLGIVARDPPDTLKPWLRPMPGTSLSGHFHAAVFGYRPVPQRSVGLAPVVNRWFQDLDLRMVLHLIEDDRGEAGAGRNAFHRGLCWVGGLGPGPAV
ncbi:MAG: STAS domain-containing protein [Gemmatimonadota bacterium]|nr:STAS domain-containing protein [Gemmatimonadota bacterium]MDH4348253.1 STAS domain-containing protein [Gemmatimonadota bacterium]MDH5282364.1 STAS domain-containing protein [Gemmatimonadota bacterium]